jgi:hypothetical protein
MKVWLGIYEHKHGTDIAVYANQAGAEAWRLALAKEFWTDRRDEETPDDPTFLDDEQINAAYWDDNERERFSVEEHPVRT